IHPRRIKPVFMTRTDGDGKTGGGWTRNLNGASKNNPDHLEELWAELEREKDFCERSVKAMTLPGHGGSTSRRKNSLVIVDEHLIIPFLLIAVEVITLKIFNMMLMIGNAECRSKVYQSS